MQAHGCTGGYFPPVRLRMCDWIARASDGCRLRDCNMGGGPSPHGSRCERNDRKQVTEIVLRGLGNTATLCGAAPKVEYREYKAVADSSLGAAGVEGASERATWSSLPSIRERRKRTALTDAFRLRGAAGRCSDTMPSRSAANCRAFTHGNQAVTSVSQPPTEVRARSGVRFLRAHRIRWSPGSVVQGRAGSRIAARTQGAL